jgi:hypothetical protein
LIGALRSVESNPPIPSTNLTNLQISSSKLAEEIDLFETDLNNIDSNGGVNAVNATDWTLTSAENGIIVAVADSRRDIMIATDDVLTYYYQISPIVSASGYETFAGAVDKLADMLKEARDQGGLISEVHKSVEK